MNAHHSRRLPGGLIIAGSVFGAVLTVGLMWLLITVVNQADDNHELKAQINAEAAKVEALSAQVESLGEKPVVDPEAKQPAGPGGVTEDEVRAIVAEEVLNRELNLTPAQVDRIASEAARQIPKPKDGQPGKPGLTPTPEQVRAIVSQVVAELCANDACRGEDGDDGTDGVDGEPGPPPTDEQLDAAFARYCAARPSGTCEGDRGPAGPEGRGVERLEFVRTSAGECVARVTFTDGTTQDAPAGDAACPPPIPTPPGD